MAWRKFRGIRRAKSVNNSSSFFICSAHRFSFLIFSFFFFFFKLIYNLVVLGLVCHRSFMISPFYPHNNNLFKKIWIPIFNSSPLFSQKASFFLLIFTSISIASLLLYISSTSGGFLFSRAMKVHPVPTKKRNNITIRFYDANTTTTTTNSSASHKKLRRLPHIFTRVLELPFRSDAEVVIEESPDCFKFVAVTDGIGEVRAHTIQIYPGIIKIVVRPNGSLQFTSLDELELDMWRFRLPETTRPELASAVFADGELIVTVPKGGEVEGLDERVGGGGGGNGGGGSGENGRFRGGMGNNRLVLVQ